MSDRSFFDSNVLVYTDDRDSPGKQDRALDLIEQARKDQSGVVSTQVLQEYFVAATRKLRVDITLARRKVELFAKLDLVQVDIEAILAAIDIARLDQLSFWDALIISAARRAGCTVLYSEDLQHGRHTMGLTIVNPFA